MGFRSYVRRILIFIILGAILGNITLVIYLPISEQNTASNFYRYGTRSNGQRSMLTVYMDWLRSLIYTNKDAENAGKMLKKNANVIVDSSGIEWQTYVKGNAPKTAMRSKENSITNQNNTNKLAKDADDNIYDKKGKSPRDPNLRSNVTQAQYKANVQSELHASQRSKSDASKNSSNDRNKLKKNAIKAKNTTKGLALSVRPSFITMYPAKGKLGNQMFQLAVLLGLADNTNHTPILTSPFPDLDSVFDLPHHIYATINTTGFNVVRENETSISDLTKHIDSHKNWTLDGYFQNYQLFSNVNEDRLRSVFRFKPNLIKLGLEFINKTVPPGNVKVGVHVRRGDVVMSWQRKLGRTSPDTGYYKKAMEFYRSKHKNVTFIIVSDDKQWFKENLGGSGDMVISPFRDKGSDLALLSLCDHTVISVGTFGWWGAWLAGGTVVYYGQQYRPGSELDRQFVKHKYFPHHWISLYSSAHY